MFCLHSLALPGISWQIPLRVDPHDFPLISSQSTLVPSVFIPFDQRSLISSSQAASLELIAYRDAYRAYTITAEIGQVRYVNILPWFRDFQDKLLYLVLFSLYLGVLWELGDKRNLTNLQI